MWSDVAQRPAVPAPLATDATDATQRKASAVTQGFLQIDRLSKAFVPAKPVFADVSFTLDKGEFVFLVGIPTMFAASGYAFDSYGGVQGRWGLPQAEARRWTDASFSW